jgi:DNA primase
MRSYLPFPPRFLDEIRARVSVSEIVSRKVKLQRKGHELQGLCPFHNEKTPSFTVNDQKGFYHCFGCGAHGDIIRFISETERLPFPEIIEKLAAMAGLEVPKPSPEQAALQKQESSLAEVVEMACQWFQTQLQQHPSRFLIDYLKQRGLNPDIQHTFRLGYAPDSYNALSDHLKSKDVSLSLIKQAGLITVGKSGETYDKFRNRLIFPIKDARGRVVAFGGRILGEGNPKYLNSPETSLFKKGTLLYHYDHARTVAHTKGRMVVAEGYMDVIALWRAGIDEAVAPMGTAITDSQLQLLWKSTNEPILCLDGDAAGKRAMERAAGLAFTLLQPGKSLRFALLPNGMDPDDILRTQGNQVLQSLIHAAKPLSDIMWSIELEREPIKTPEQKAELDQRIQTLVNTIQHPSLRNYYHMFFREKLWKLNKRGSKTHSVTAQRQSIQSPDILLEEDILAVLLSFPSLLKNDALCETLNAIEFSSKILDRIRILALEEGVYETVMASGWEYIFEKAGLLNEIARLKLVYKSTALSTIPLTENDVKARIEYSVSSLHLLHLKEEQQEIRMQCNEESEKRAIAFQEEIDRWEQLIQKLELLDSDEERLQ